MIEALIDPDTGDVIVVKPVGSVWGRAEVNAVVKLDDSELEKALVGRERLRQLEMRLGRCWST